MDQDGKVGIGVLSPVHSLDVNGTTRNTSGSWISGSDKRLKSNIKSFNGGLQEVLRINPVSYRYNGKGGIEKSNKEYVGVIAQEFMKIAPYAVSEYEFVDLESLKTADGEEKEIVKSKESYLQVDNGPIKWLLVNAIKEQQSIIDTQKEDINQLKDEIGELRSLIKDLASAQTSSKDVHLQGEAFLGQNEPNPFNASTKIAYKLPDGISSGEIAFYGLDGSMLHTVQINEAQGNINLSQDDLPNGQYTYSLIVNGRIMDTKKMILIK